MPSYFSLSPLLSFVLIYAKRSIEKEIDVSHHGLYYTAHLLCLAGLSGILCTGDFFNLFVFLEISSLATYTLVSLGKDRRCLTGAFRYLSHGNHRCDIYFDWCRHVVHENGDVNMVDLAVRIAEHHDSRTLNTGLAFIIVGVSNKAAIFPLHMWLIPATHFHHQRSPHFWLTPQR